MSLRAKMAKGGMLVAGGQLVNQACSFVRNVIVARMVSPADFGVAATFAITISILEMLSNLGSEKLLIQAKDGGDPKLQAAAQAVLALRGLAAGTAIWICSESIAALFGTPQAAWAFRWLAVVPVLRGLMHFDMHRKQRDLSYRHVVMVEAAATVTTTAMAYPLACWFRDYSAMLSVLLFQALLTTAGSFIVADRPYRWGWNSDQIKRIVRFGWPLLINGFLLFCIMQGDRFIIGTADRLFGAGRYSLADLGASSVAFSLTFAPTAVLAKVCTSLFLPLLSRKREEGRDMTRLYRSMAQLCAAASGLFALPFLLAGQLLVVMCFGSKYLDAGGVIAWLAGMQALRVARISPTLVAMAHGDTKNAMVANTWRLLSMAFVFVLAWRGVAMPWIAAAGFLAEMLAMIAAALKLSRDHLVPAAVWLKPTVQSMAMVAVLGLLGVLSTHWGPVWQILITAFAGLAYMCCVVVAFPELRIYLFSESSPLRRYTPEWLLRLGLGVASR